MNNEFFNEFNKFYFINSSCIGPFIPPAYSVKWIDIFNDMLDENDMIGPVIEIPDDNLGFKSCDLELNDSEALNYLNNYPDLIEAFGKKNIIKAKEHWMKYGMKEGRNAKDNINKLLKYDATKNIPFIHTYMFGVNNKGFIHMREVLKNINDMSKIYCICNTERKLTSYLIMNGCKIKSCLTRFKNVDLNKEENWDCFMWNKYNKTTCYEVPKNYFQIDLNPYEILFVKNINV